MFEDGLNIFWAGYSSWHSERIIHNWEILWNLAFPLFDSSYNFCEQ